MNKRACIALAAFIFVMTSPASAQTLLEHFSQGTIDKVAARFSAALHDGGMTGVVTDIKACYAVTTFKHTKENGAAIAFCMLYDYAAYDFDKGMRTNFVAQGLNDPGNVSTYLSDDALGARFAIYAPIPFGDNPASVGAYFADAPSQVLAKLHF